VREDFDLNLEGAARDFLLADTIEYYLVDTKAFPEEECLHSFELSLRELAAVSACTSKAFITKGELPKDIHQLTNTH
jgi:hypothetical protein